MRFLFTRVSCKEGSGERVWRDGGVEGWRCGREMSARWKKCGIGSCVFTIPNSYDAMTDTGSNTERVQDAFSWTPPSTTSKFAPGLEVRDPETRRPRYRFVRAGSSDPAERILWFVNESDETLPVVRLNSGGFLTADDDVINQESDDWVYRDVQPGEAVKADVYSIIYDSDWLLHVVVNIERPNGKRFAILPSPEKGGHGSQVLMWDNGDLGKRVQEFKELE